MTQLDYLKDTFLFETSAQFLEVKEHEKGIAVLLSNTIFYPQGGGQPADQGQIIGTSGEFQVQDVRLDAEGVVWHFGSFTSGSFTANERVTLKINRERRIQHAKIHSAGHLLDCAVEKLQLTQIIPTKGFHFPEGPYVEYEGVLENGAEMLPQIQTALNEVIGQNPAVIVKELTYEEAQAQGISAPPGKSARIVNFEGFAACGCGGTHMPNAQEIGSIQLRKIKSKKGKTKISYEVSF
ncbi:MAG TPA: hypothetical protein DCS93_40570 [Microscillaceae bacterium]|nr:hypothetical protein [Microscillaceae bacterium]